MRTFSMRARALISVLLGIVLVGATLPASAANPGGFVDVTEDDTFATEIAWMSDAGITRGWATGSGVEFRPLTKVTREQMAAFLYRYAGAPSYSPPSTPSFDDVPTTSTFYKQIEWLAEEGITTGWADGTFRPLGRVTREQMAAFLFRLESGTAPSGADAFADSGESVFADEIEWLATTGVSEGWLNWRGRVYKPTLQITREAMAAFLYRLSHGADPVTAHAPVFEPTAKVYVKTATLAFRASPSSSATVKVNAVKNAVGVFDGAREYGWIRVRIGDTLGWAPAASLTRTKPAFTSQRIGLDQSSVVVRANPSKTAAAVTTIEQGVRGIYLGAERNNGWWQVKFGTQVGWVHRSKLNLAPAYNAAAALAKAHSQVGYLEPAWRVNKFNDWANGTYAWCAVYQMWVMDQIGYPQGVPYQIKYSNWAADALASGVVDTNVSASDLKPGYIVLVDWPPYGSPTHAAMVDHVVGDKVILVEGNTTSGTGSSARGVFVRERRIVDIYGVFDPDEYARVNGY